MATLTWDGIGERIFETGVSKGVFYDFVGAGVAWNGLISIDENIDTEVEAVIFDGLKINDIITLGNFSATLRAFTYPDEFLPYEGIIETDYGVMVTDQPYERFGLCYQTQVGDDVNGLETNYKIHVIYNLTALVSTKAYQTMSLESQPHEFEWTISAIPEEIENYRSTAHLIFDSRKIAPEVMSKIKEVLYGTDMQDAYLPPASQLMKMIKDWILALP